MIREVIVTSPQGVRLAFTATGEKGLYIDADALPSMVLIRDMDTSPERCTGMIPTSWLIELNETVT